MVANISNRKRQGQHTNHVAARLLVLGDRHVGKSATIVRYTTGRYIQEYSDSTNDWLYKHPLGFDLKRNQSTSVELLEQRDIKFCNSSKFFSCSIDEQKQQQQQQQLKSLATRAAQDQQLTNELHEKQEMLNKLYWADAYVVIYAIDERSTFNKAIKYLNLIANNINSPIDAHHNSCNSSGSGSGSSSSCGNSKSSPNQLGCNCNLNQSSHNGNVASTRRPILLLGNKRDLERSNRQVSHSDGRLLAMRHQSMFAEISIAESNKLIESFLYNLIEQIDPISLHPIVEDDYHHLHQVACNRHQVALTKWRPTVEAALGQTGIHLTAPIWGNLVKSKPLGSTMVAQSSQVAGSKLEISDIYSAMKPIKVLVAKSVEVNDARKAQIDNCSPLMKVGPGIVLHQSARATIQPQPMALRCTNLTSNSTPATTTANNYQNKYRNLKSSFKRASMAIVSSKTLASNKASKLTSANQKRSSTTSSEHDSISEHSSISSPGQSGRSSFDCQQNTHNSNPTKQKLNFKGDTLPPIKPNTSEKFKRPLFRYKSRRTTVAFEEIGDTNGASDTGACVTKKISTGSQMNLILSQSKLSLNKAVSDENGSFPNHLARDNSVRSSSSLSTSDTNYRSSLVLCDLEGPNSLGIGRSTSAGSTNCSSQTSRTPRLGVTRNDSNATLSHNSSYEESGDELIGGSNSINSRASLAQNFRITNNNNTMYQSDSSVGLNEFIVRHNQVNQSPPVNKKRYDLVKSVQSTFSNLTRSSNITGQLPKRSFCSTIFRQSNPDATTTVKKIINQPLMDMAKTENIRQMPAMVGPCQ